MTALKPMNEAPRNGSPIWAAWSGQMVPAFWLDNTHTQFPWAGFSPYRMAAVSGQPEGYLPLPASAESRDVASTAAEWLSVCQPEDVAEAIRTLLGDEEVREMLRDALRPRYPASHILDTFADRLEYLAKESDR